MDGVAEEAPVGRGRRYSWLLDKKKEQFISLVLSLSWNFFVFKRFLVAGDLARGRSPFPRRSEKQGSGAPKSRGRAFLIRGKIPELGDTAGSGSRRRLVSLSRLVRNGMCNSPATAWARDVKFAIRRL